MPSVIIGADICPIEANQPYFRRGDAPSLFHDLLPEFAQADLVVANLECPFIERPSPILKTGPTFGEPGDCINGIKAAGIDVLCLANNHIMDHGAPGLAHTLDVCACAGIATVGAGANLTEARRILTRQLEDVRVGILALAEHEFSIATNDTWGANPFDLMDCVRNLQASRAACDYLVVLLHGGDEFCVPSPRIQNTCRFLIELGAKAVIVQHPHVLGGYEDYHGGHIVYGQGALVMDEAIYRDRKSFHEGFLVKLTLDQAEDGDQNSAVGGPWSAVRGLTSVHRPPSTVIRAWRSTMELIPFLQSDPGPGARRMKPEVEQRFRQSLAERSAAIRNAAFVEAEWLRFCEERRKGYLHAVLGHNRVLRKLDVGGWLTRLLHGRRALLGTRNCVLCETHREALETIFTRLWK
jgi:poly-gamma-glutamate synthesis protein (capsule biosynthesis protein)